MHIINQSQHGTMMLRVFFFKYLHLIKCELSVNGNNLHHRTVEQIPTTCVFFLNKDLVFGNAASEWQYAGNKKKKHGAEEKAGRNFWAEEMPCLHDALSISFIHSFVHSIKSQDV